MPYGARVCFHLAGEGSLTSEEEFIEFRALSSDLLLKLSAGNRGDILGKSKRFSISSEPFETFEEAQNAGESVLHALLLHSARTRRGLDLGQNGLRSFDMSAEFKQILAHKFDAQTVTKDQLGLTVYPTNPKPAFVRINAEGNAGLTAEFFIADLAATIDSYRFTSTKAELAAGLYAINHFVGRAPARFLLLFVALETLFETLPRSSQAQNHVNSLIDATNTTALSNEEKLAICSALSFQKRESIACAGRRLAESLLADQIYDSLPPGQFFKKIYRVRNDMVHRGRIDAESLHVLVNEVDRFVANIISCQAHLVQRTSA